VEKGRRERDFHTLFFDPHKERDEREIKRKGGSREQTGPRMESGKKSITSKFN